MILEAKYSTVYINIGNGLRIYEIYKRKEIFFIITKDYEKV